MPSPPSLPLPAPVHTPPRFPRGRTILSYGPRTGPPPEPRHSPPGDAGQGRAAHGHWPSRMGPCGVGMRSCPSIAGTGSCSDHRPKPSVHARVMRCRRRRRPVDLDTAAPAAPLITPLPGGAAPRSLRSRAGRPPDVRVFATRWEPAPPVAVGTVMLGGTPATGHRGPRGCVRSGGHRCAGVTRSGRPRDGFQQHGRMGVEVTGRMRVCVLLRRPIAIR